MSRKVGECPAARGYCKGNQYNGGSGIYLLSVPVSSSSSPLQPQLFVLKFTFDIRIHRAQKYHLTINTHSLREYCMIASSWMNQYE